MVVVVIPCYNESKRLKIDSFLSNSSEKLQILFVDDGSTDGTSDIIASSISGHSYCHIISLIENKGKAEAVRQGMLHAMKSVWAAESEWFGYMDADLSAPLSEVEQLIKYQEVFYPKAEAVWGIRLKRLGSTIIRSSVRHFIGRIFVSVTDLLLHINTYDSQCGAKFFKKKIIAQAFSERFLSQWLFDIEILLRLKQSGVVECPLSQWNDTPGSKINVFRDFLRVVYDLVRIKIYYRV